MCSLLSKRDSRVMCARRSRWFSRKYLKMAPAAPMARRLPETPKPSRVAVPKCRLRSLWAEVTSKFHSPKEVTRATPSTKSSRLASSLGSRSAGQSSSAGASTFKRSTMSSTGPSSTTNDPVVRSRAANPMLALPSGHTAARVGGDSEPSTASTVAVPGVRISTISRLTMPLASLGSSTCSTTTTFSPAANRRARYLSAAWYGTPARGMRSLSPWEREVRAIERMGAALTASSPNIS